MNIVTQSKESAKETRMILDEVAKQVGLNINNEKTKIIIQTRTKTLVKQNVTLSNYNFDQSTVLHTKAQVSQRVTTK